MLIRAMHLSLRSGCMHTLKLKKFITPDWQKASKIIHQFLSKAKNTTGDAYLLWRLKTMIAMEQFDVQGKLGNMKDFEVKAKANVQ